MIMKSSLNLVTKVLLLQVAGEAERLTVPH